MGGGGEPTRLSWDEIQARATAFSNRWRDARREKADAQPFVAEFLGVFGVADPVKAGEREKPVKIAGEHDKYIDFFWKNRIAIEMKSRDQEGGAAGSRRLENAHAQLRGYMEHIPDGDMPDLWMVCDFETIRLWRRSTSEKSTFKLKDLRRHIRRFAGLAGYAAERVREEQAGVDVKAAEKMARLHEALEGHGYAGHDLELCLVRLLFCLFAGDAGIFPRDSLFNYLEQSRPDGSDLSDRLNRLFEVLNLPPEARAKRTLLSDELRQFRYINGNLFARTLPAAEFNAAMRKLLLDCARFDWRAISPAIFGAMFQGVMDKARRRELGAHYTSEENILKLVNPLFMDGLRREFERVRADPAGLERFHDKIAGLKFLDPACGCGNFLILAYRELRELELAVLEMKVGTGQRRLDISSLLRVGVGQFYGIECEDFPCQIAQTGLWLMDHLMNLKVSERFGQYVTRLPLARGMTITRGNALRLDWESVIPKADLSYILGNPPFNGARMMSASQKAEVREVFGDLRGAGNLDYVTAWYRKAADLMAGTAIKAAFVSTNSITQGEQPAILWKPLMERGFFINFGLPAFKWSNEARGKAAVHCVIIGFSQQKTRPNITPYLTRAPTFFIENRSRPLCDAPEMGIGNKPIDGGNYLFTEREMRAFSKKEPESAKYFRKWIGSDEFINGGWRYCLWLGDCPPSELRRLPEAMKRVEAVRRFRLASQSEPTRRLADTPRRFHVENMPKSPYLVIPEVSSENRSYIPIGFLKPSVLVSNLVKIIPSAALYHFGILSSSVHMAWVRAVCGRLKSDYRYSIGIVYNNFPWPEADAKRRADIEGLAKAVLEARARFPQSALADLYDPLAMPPELRKAHRNLDRAVMKLYGFAREAAEAAVVATLMERHRRLAASRPDGG